MAPVHLYSQQFFRTDVALTLIPQLKALYITTTNVPNLYKLYLSQVILLLSIKDEISAKKELELCMGNVDFTGSEECEVASGYIEAFEKGDSELLVKLSKRGVITRLENEVRAPIAIQWNASINNDFRSSKLPCQLTFLEAIGLNRPPIPILPKRLQAPLAADQPLH